MWVIIKIKQVFIIYHTQMTTIQLEVPKELVWEVSTWKWENRLKKIWEYKKDQEDIELVHDAMEHDTKSVSLKDYLKSCDK